MLSTDTNLRIYSTLKYIFSSAVPKVGPVSCPSQGGGRQVYSDSSGLLVAEQEAGKLDAARAGLWLQLVGRRGTPKLLLLNSCCAPRPDQLRSQAAAAGCRLALGPSGLAAAANPLMATRQQLTVRGESCWNFGIFMVIRQSQRFCSGKTFTLL